MLQLWIGGDLAVLIHQQIATERVLLHTGVLFRGRQLTRAKCKLRGIDSYWERLKHLVWLVHPDRKLLPPLFSDFVHAQPRYIAHCGYGQ